MTLFDSALERQDRYQKAPKSRDFGTKWLKNARKQAKNDGFCLLIRGYYNSLSCLFTFVYDDFSAGKVGLIGAEGGWVQFWPEFETDIDLGAIGKPDNLRTNVGKVY